MKLKGRVTDNKGCALIGATINNLMASDTTSTDTDGKFEIDVNNGHIGDGDAIEIKYKGYKKVIISMWKPPKRIIIVMKKDKKNIRLDDIQDAINIRDVELVLVALRPKMKKLTIKEDKFKKYWVSLKMKGRQEYLSEYRFDNIFEALADCVRQYTENI